MPSDCFGSLCSIRQRPLRSHPRVRYKTPRTFRAAVLPLHQSGFVEAVLRANLSGQRQDRRSPFRGVD